MSDGLKGDLEEFHTWKVSRGITKQVELNLTKKYAWMGAIAALFLSISLTAIVQNYISKALGDTEDALKKAEVKLEVSLKLLGDAEVAIKELRSRANLVDTQVSKFKGSIDGVDKTIALINEELVFGGPSGDRKKDSGRAIEAIEKVGISPMLEPGFALVCEGSNFLNKTLLILSVQGTRLISVDASVSKKCKSIDEPKILLNERDALNVGLSAQSGALPLRISFSTGY